MFTLETSFHAETNHRIPCAGVGLGSSSMSQIPSAKTWARSSFLYSALKFCKEKKANQLTLVMLAVTLTVRMMPAAMGCTTEVTFGGKKITSTFWCYVGRTIVHYQCHFSLRKAHFAVQPIHVLREESTCPPDSSRLSCYARP